MNKYDYLIVGSGLFGMTFAHMGCQAWETLSGDRKTEP